MAKTTMLIVESKTIYNTNTAEEKGYDTEEGIPNKPTYRSRHFMATHTIIVTTANITEQSWVIDIFDQCCNVSNHLSMVKKFGSMETTPKNTQPLLSEIFVMGMLKLANTTNSTPLLYY